MGVLLLGLVSDWDSWISRRVDSFHFAGDDERVLHRRQSVDFVVPRSLGSTDAKLAERYGGLAVPITFVRKWRLPEFSLRDAAENAVPLLQREDSTPLAAAMLVALGTFVKSGGTTLLGEAGSDSWMPDALREEMQAIAAGEPMAAMRRCVNFQNTNLAAPADVLEWRRALANSELFMSLAYELAGGFLLFAVLPSDARGRQVLKFSYNSYVVPPGRDHWLVRLGHACRWLGHFSRDAVDPVRWKRSSSLRLVRAPSAQPLGTGRLVLSVTSDGTSERLRYGLPSMACGLATIRGPSCGRQAVRLRPSGISVLAGLKPGKYSISVKGRSGFWVEPRHFELTIGPKEVKRVSVRARRVRFARFETQAAPAIAALAWLGKRLSRGLGWSSKPLAIRVRLGGGGSYHCEFEAPPGLHVTRAQLVSNLDGNEAYEDGSPMRRTRARNADTVLESTQRAHLYHPAQDGDPATGYAFLNLRPRAETIVRPAMFTALFTVVILGILAYVWNCPPKTLDRADPPLGLLAIIFGGPSALAAYFAQAVPSRVTNAMLYGIRLVAVLPLALSVLAAGAILRWGESAGPALIAVAIVAGIAAAALRLTYRLAEHPREQRPVAARQGNDFEWAHIPPFDPVDHGAQLSPAASRGTAEIRDRMLERAGGMTAATRRELLGQRSFLLWERDVPPALYFDSVEAPAVFLGPVTAADRRGLKSCVQALSAGQQPRPSKPQSTSQ